MSLRTGMNAPAVLIDKYINSAYDTVKLVADNIDSLITIGDEISDGNPSIFITITSLVSGTDLGITYSGGETFINLNAYAESYTMGRNQMHVYLNGLNQSTASGALVEISTTYLKLTGLLEVGDRLDIIKII